MTNEEAEATVTSFEVDPQSARPERRSRGSRAQRFLAEAGAILAASLNYEETLASVARLSVPEIADWCSVNLVTETESIIRVAVAHIQPEKEELLKRLRAQYAPKFNSHHPVATAIAADRPVLIAEVTDEYLQSISEDEHQLSLERELGTHSVIIAPLSVRGRVLGAITLAMSTSQRVYGDADIAMAQDLARRAAVAIDNARLYRDAQEAEARARQQAARIEALAEASQAFAMARLDLDAVLNTVSRRVAELLGDACSIRLLSDDGQFNLPVAFHHTNPDALEVFTSHATFGPRRAYEGTVGQVLQTGEPLLLTHRTLDEWREIAVPNWIPYIEQFGMHSILIVPLRAGGTTIGTLGLWRESTPEAFTLDDQHFVQDLADRAGLAVDNARLYHASQAAAEQAMRHADQLRGLATAAIAINSELSLDQVLRLVTDQARTIIGAHQAATSMTTNRDWAHSINVVSYSEKYRAYERYNAVPAGYGIYRLVCDENRPYRMTQDQLEAHPSWRGFGAEADNHPPMRGWLAAPLINRSGQNVGLIQLTDKVEGEFTETDEAILVQFAHMASEAIENARLYNEAQSAIAARDEFLSVAAHELKTPVTSLRGFAQLLLRRFQRGYDITPDKMRVALTSIDRQTWRLSALISQLLDTTRIQSGELKIQTNRVDLAELINEMVEHARTLSDTHSIVTSVDQPLLAEVDSLRIEQVLTNLVENAIKYSPAGGQILVEAGTLDDGRIRIAVEDDGQGIPEAERERIFERFYQINKDGSATGMGLGLYISRQIVTLHGGTINAESPDSGGTRFVVRLPASQRDRGQAE